MNIIICGAGRVGFAIAKLLTEQNHSVTVIDQSSEDIQKINEALDVKAIVGKATSPIILENANSKEADMIIDKSTYKDGSVGWPYVYQGATFEVAHSYLDSDLLVPVHRFYNTKTGHHFFTTSEDEANTVKAKSASGEWPFVYEGTRFNVYSDDPNPDQALDETMVWRFYSPSLDRHFFTGFRSEAEALQLTGVWNLEGVAFWGEYVGL